MRFDIVLFAASLTTESGRFQMLPQFGRALVEKIPQADPERTAITLFHIVGRHVDRNEARWFVEKRVVDMPVATKKPLWVFFVLNVFDCFVPLILEKATLVVAMVVLVRFVLAVVKGMNQRGMFLVGRVHPDETNHLVLLQDFLEVLGFSEHLLSGYALDFESEVS